MTRFTRYWCAAVFGVLMLMSTVVHAQQPARNRIRPAVAHGVVDTATVRELLSRSEQLRRQSPKSALEYCEKAVRLADSLGIRRLRARAYASYGSLLNEQNMNERAQTYLDEAMSLSEKEDDAVLTASILVTMGKVEQSHGHIDKALELLHRAGAASERVHDARGAGTALFNIARILMRQGRIDSAMACFERTLVFYKEAGYPYGTLATHGNMANILGSQGRYEEALGRYEHVLSVSEELGERRSMAIALTQIGNIHSRQSRYREAMACYNRCMDLWREMGDSTGIARTRDDIASVHFLQGKYQQAMELYQMSLMSSEASGDDDAVATTLNNIGNIHNVQGRLDQALAHFRRSAEISQRRKHPRLVAWSLKAMANVLTQQGKYQEAMEHVHRSLVLYRELGEKSGIHVTTSTLATLHQSMGRYREAIELYLEAMTLARELGDDRGETHALGKIAAIHLAQGRPDSALVLGTRAYDRARDIGALDEQELILGILSRASAETGEYRKAYEYERAFYLVHDSLVNIANLKSINEMSARYESEQKEKTIALLTRDTQLQALELDGKQKEVAMQQLITERIRQRAILLVQENEIRMLELDQRTKDVELQRTEKEMNARKVELLSKDNQLQLSMVSREQTVRNAILLGVGMLLIIGYLGSKRMKEKRQEATLRAEAAEYKAKAAEAESLRTQSAFERHRLESQLEFSRQLINSQEEERNRIAIGLHDQLGQDIVVIRNSILVSLKEGRDDARLQEAADTAGMMLENVRRLARDLRPYQLEHLGLTNAFSDMIARVSGSADVQFTLEIDPLDGAFDKNREINIYRIVQECVNNIVRHSEAKRATIRVVRSDDLVELVVEDDGRGMREEEHPHGFGLAGIRQRIELLGGVMRIDSSPGRGTKVIASIPATAEGRSVLETAQQEKRHG